MGITVKADVCACGKLGTIVLERSHTRSSPHTFSVSHLILTVIIFPPFLPKPHAAGNTARVVCGSGHSRISPTPLPPLLSFLHYPCVHFSILASSHFLFVYPLCVLGLLERGQIFLACFFLIVSEAGLSPFGMHKYMRIVTCSTHGGSNTYLTTTFDWLIFPAHTCNCHTCTVSLTCCPSVTLSPLLLPTAGIRPPTSGPSQFDTI